MDKTYVRREIMIRAFAPLYLFIIYTISCILLTASLFFFHSYMELLQNSLQKLNFNFSFLTNLSMSVSYDFGNIHPRVVFRFLQLCLSCIICPPLYPLYHYYKNFQQFYSKYPYISQNLAFGAATHFAALITIVIDHFERFGSFRNYIKTSQRFKKNAAKAAAVIVLAAMAASLMSIYFVELLFFYFLMLFSLGFAIIYHRAKMLIILSLLFLFEELDQVFAVGRSGVYTLYTATLEKLFDTFVRTSKMYEAYRQYNNVQAITLKLKFTLE